MNFIQKNKFINIVNPSANRDLKSHTSDGFISKYAIILCYYFKKKLKNIIKTFCFILFL